MELSAFIARFEAGLDTLDGVGWHEARRRYDRLCQHFAPPDPAALGVSDERVAGVAVRRYSPRHRAPGRVLFVHGALHAHTLLPEMQNAWQDFCQALQAQIAA
ncbi:hypothetical protein [Halomonas faecis]|uniref:hypothetical protein n=1 Tax=Halomonas faecis TaxID=1562110 RepID=UPI0013D5ADBC|nr:hypothetical protein [Halomonas faecis]